MSRRTPTDALWLLLLGGLVLAIGYSGLRVVDNAHAMRALYRESDSVQRANDEQLAVYSRLRLEVGALTSLPNIEDVARNRLDMEFPEAVEQVLE